MRTLTAPAAGRRGVRGPRGRSPGGEQRARRCDPRPRRISRQRSAGRPGRRDARLRHRRRLRRGAVPPGRPRTCRRRRHVPANSAAARSDAGAARLRGEAGARRRDLHVRVRHALPALGGFPVGQLDADRAAGVRRLRRRRAGARLHRFRERRPQGPHRRDPERRAGEVSELAACVPLVERAQVEPARRARRGRRDHRRLAGRREAPAVGAHGRDELDSADALARCGRQAAARVPGAEAALSLQPRGGGAPVRECADRASRKSWRQPTPASRRASACRAC